MQKDNKKLEEYKEFMTLMDISEYLGIHINSIYTYIHEGGEPLPSIKISNKKILVKKKDLINWLEEHKKGYLFEREK